MGKGLQVEVEWGNDEEKKGQIYYSESSEVNNISQKNLNYVSEPKRPFLIGTSKFSDNCYFMNSYTGMISKQSSNENGEIDFYVKIRCVNVLGLIMKFDDEVCPTKILVDDKEYANDTSLFFVSFDTIVNNYVTIRFTKLNRANKPLTIKFITPSLTRRYDSGQISNLTIGSTISSENGLSYGVVGKYGSFTLHDKRHEIYSILKNIDFCNFNTRVYYNEKIIGTFKVQEITSSETDYNYTVTLKDLTDELENSVVYPFFYSEVYTISGFLTKIKENTNSDFLKNCKVNLTNVKDYRGNSLEALFNTNSKMDILFNTEKKSVMSMLNEFCETFQVNMLISDDGKDLEVVNFG